MLKKLVSNERGSVVVWGCGLVILLLFLMTLFFIWYYNNGLPRPYPTDTDNLFWGFLHGVFIVPDLVLSLFVDDVAIYQTPNIGDWYNIGFVVGASVAFGGGSSAGSAAVGAQSLRRR